MQIGVLAGGESCAYNAFANLYILSKHTVIHMHEIEVNGGNPRPNAF
jgi:hypothetical protein